MDELKDIDSDKLQEAYKAFCVDFIEHEDSLIASKLSQDFIPLIIDEEE